MKCNVCNYKDSSLQTIRKHFLKEHGFQPGKENLTIRSVTDHKDSTNDQIQQEVPRGYTIPSSQALSLTTTDSPSVIEARHTKTPSPPLQVKVEENKSLASQGQDESSVKSSDIKTETGTTSVMKCHDCGQEFSTRDWGVFKRHMRAHDQPNARCQLCKQTFLDAAELEEHNVAYHNGASTQGKSAMTHACTMCDVAFAQPGALDKHIKDAHHGMLINDKELRCLYCDAKFSEYRYLMLHVMDHEGNMEAKKEAEETKTPNNLTIPKEKPLEITAKETRISNEDSGGDLTIVTSPVISRQNSPEVPSVSKEAEEKEKQPDHRKSPKELEEEYNANTDDEGITKKTDQDQKLEDKKEVLPSSDVVTSEAKQTKPESPKRVASPSAEESCPMKKQKTEETPPQRAMHSFASSLGKNSITCYI